MVNMERVAYASGLSFIIGVLLTSVLYSTLPYDTSEQDVKDFCDRCMIGNFIYIIRVNPVVKDINWDEFKTKSIATTLSTLPLYLKGFRYGMTKSNRLLDIAKDRCEITATYLIEMYRR